MARAKWGDRGSVWERRFCLREIEIWLSRNRNVAFAKSKYGPRQTEIWPPPNRNLPCAESKSGPREIDMRISLNRNVDTSCTQNRYPCHTFEKLFVSGPAAEMPKTFLKKVFGCRPSAKSRKTCVVKFLLTACAKSKCSLRLIEIWPFSNRNVARA